MTSFTRCLLLTAVSLLPVTGHAQAPAPASAAEPSGDAATDVAILEALAAEVGRRHNVPKSGGKFPGALHRMPLDEPPLDVSRQFAPPENFRIRSEHADGWITGLARNREVPASDDLAYVETPDLDRVYAKAAFRFMAQQSLIGENNFKSPNQLIIPPNLTGGVRRYFQDMHDGMTRARQYTPVLVRVGNDVPDNPPYKLNTQTLFARASICNDDKYLKDQPSCGVCSGVVLTRRTILTAGHCADMFTSDDQVRFVFGFDELQDASAVLEVHKGRVLRRGATKTEDWVIYETAAELPLSRVPKHASRYSPLDTVYAAGYPLATPFQLVEYGRVEDIQDSYLLTSLDTYGGMSGGPVFNTRHELVGIIVGGGRDLYQRGSCFRTCECSEDYRSSVPECNCQPEQVFRLSAVLDRIGKKPPA